MQLKAMHEYVVHRGWTILTEVQDVNGGTKLRPKREELIRMARQRKLDIIVVWRLDRWGRSLADLTHSLEELRTLDVDFVSITEGLDFGTPTGRAMAGMLGVFAQFERDVLRDRVIAGMEHARAKGVVLGRPALSRQIADHIRELFAQGHSKKQIAKLTGVPRTTVIRTLGKESSELQAA
jgi:DNA invertase Pin-like site-specific DNA recombinase